MSDRRQPILQVRGIRKTFPGSVALDSVDFEVCSGEVHVLLGENGAGKSTLMKILSGAYLKDEGKILIDGCRAEIRNPREAADLGISAVYQELNLVPQLSAAENIFLGREPRRWPGLIDKERSSREARDLLASLGVQVEVEIPVGQLSIWAQQMVEVVRALWGNPRILIMDEPTSALTEHETERLFATIQHLRDQGVAIIYISHRLEEISRIGDRVTVLRDGKRVATHSVSAVSTSQLVRLMADHDLEEHFPKVAVAPGETLLQVDSLSRSGVLEDITFSLQAGEVLGVAGLVGAGRTALARALFGADGVDAGQIIIRGEPTGISSPTQAIRSGMGYLTEDRKSEGLILALSVKRNIALASPDRVSRLGVISSAAEQDLAARFIERLSIRVTGPDQAVVELSGGNQQKIVLSKWLACQARILIFDEPTRGVDVAAKVEIYGLMNDLTAQGAGIIMISSELPEIMGISDRILVMREGKTVAELLRSEATQEKILSAALGVEA